MGVVYSIFIRLYTLGIRISSLWNGKAKEWIEGRRSLFSDLAGNIHPGDQVIWIHCSSVGEWEQGKPIIERLRGDYPGYKIVLSFFSPSGFKAAKKYAFADIITYLPEDTPANAERFIKLLNPRLVLFVKYEFWFHHLSAVAQRQIPLLLASAVFRPDQVFFKWYGNFYLSILKLFTYIFVQDPSSQSLLKAHGIERCSISGDTRFDRVKAIASDFRDIPLLQEMHPLLVAGSTWPDDEKLLAAYLKEQNDKVILAPHEINEQHLSHIQDLFPGAIRYSAVKEPLREQPVCIIDNIGMLSRIYKYALITYVGGGFTRDGIHNILEAAVYGKPVIFGPNYQKYREAIELIRAGGAFSVANSQEFADLMKRLLTDRNSLDKAGQNALKYIDGHTGATGKVLNYIQENRLLTS